MITTREQGLIIKALNDFSDNNGTDYAMVKELEGITLKVNNLHDSHEIVSNIPLEDLTIAELDAMVIILTQKTQEASKVLEVTLENSWEGSDLHLTPTIVRWYMKGQGVNITDLHECPNNLEDLMGPWVNMNKPGGLTQQEVKLLMKTMDQDLETFVGENESWVLIDITQESGELLEVIAPGLDEKDYIVGFEKLAIKLQFGR